MRHTARLLALGVIIILLAAAVDGQERRTYAGRRVADVLRELQSAQVRIIFSSDLVPPTLTVKAEPKPASPREIAQQILASHGHLGTQFEVRLNDGGLRVSVREGTVALENARGRWISNEGDALHVVPGRAIERRSIQTDGEEWSWLNDLTPAFVLEGSTLGAFLDWAARHHGLRWRYADPAMRARVERIVLHGSIEDLSAEEALDAVLRTCGLTYRRDEKQVIVISPRR